MILKLLVYDVDYEIFENKGVIEIFCKDEEGKNFLVRDKNFFPYFYAMPKGESEKLREKIEKLETSKIGAKIVEAKIEKKIFEGKEVEVIKIIIDNPRKIPDVRDAIKDWEDVEETFEYDIPFYKRYLLDKKIEPMGWIEVEGKEVKIENKFKVDKVIEAENVFAVDYDKEVNFKIMSFDTEWIEENGKDKLIMLSLVGNDGFKKVLTCYEWENKPSFVESLKNEKEIIQRFVKIVEEEDPEFLVGYNSDGFDFPKLRKKADEFKISLKLGKDGKEVRSVRRGRISSTKIRGRVHLDLFVFIDHILSANLKSEVLTLDEVSQELLGIGKKEMGYKEMVEIWSKKEQLERLVEYSLWDSELTLKLAENILPQIFSLSKLTKLLPFDVCRNTYSQLVEAFYMSKAVEDNLLIPNRPKKEEIEKRRLAPPYKGAIVIEPKKGIHSNVLVFDFRSLYPTIIVTHNISPENLNCGHGECKEKNTVPETKYYFCIKREGFIPKHIRKLIEMRNEVKEKMKKVKRNSLDFIKLNNFNQALKTIANASYGYFGFVGARWYKRECGSACAAWGRKYIKQVIEMAKKNGFEVIYGDTDSCFLKLGNNN